MVGFNRRDAALKVTKALPGSATTVYSDPIKIGHAAKGDFLAECEVLISAPALNATRLPDTQTVTYFLQCDDNLAFASAAGVGGVLITQTGAGGTGAAAATKRIRLPTDVEGYIRLGMTKTGAADASGVSGTLEMLF